MLHSLKQDVDINKFPSADAGNVSGTSPDFAFGRVWMQTEKGATRAYTTDFIIKGSDGSYNNCSGAYLSVSLSTVYQIVARDDYYNKVKLTSDGTNAYSSVFLPFAATIPVGIKAFAVESKGDTYAVMEEIVDDAGGTLPANTAAILKKYSQATDMDPIYLSPAEESGSFSGTNLLEGTVVAKTRSDLETEKEGTGTIYVLGKIDNEIGLCKYTADDLAEGKAYLFVKGESSPTKALTLYFGDETTLDTVKAEQTDKAPVYDLSGRRVERATRGLYIQNGKKFVVK